MSKSIVMTIVLFLSSITSWGQSDCDRWLESQFPEMRMLQFEGIGPIRIPVVIDEGELQSIESPLSFYMAREPVSYELFHVVLRLFEQRFATQQEIREFAMFLNPGGVHTPVWHLSFEQVRTWILMLNMLSFEDSGLEHWIEGHIKGDYYRLPTVNEWLISLNLSQIGQIHSIKFYEQLNGHKVTEFTTENSSIRVGVSSVGNYINPIYRAQVNHKKVLQSIPLFRIIRDAKIR